MSLDKHARRRRATVSSVPQTDKMNASIPAELYKKFLHPQGQYDTFIHSWSPDFKLDLSALYQPKESLFENEGVYEGEINAVMAQVLDNVGILNRTSASASDRSLWHCLFQKRWTCFAMLRIRQGIATALFFSRARTFFFSTGWTFNR